jgi:hypothetical protein
MWSGIEVRTVELIIYTDLMVYQFNKTSEPQTEGDLKDLGSDCLNLDSKSERRSLKCHR